MVLLLSLCSLTARASVGPDIGPYRTLSGIPARVDAAAVFENPAEQILLSPVGRSMRSLLALAGVFSQTENAWGALARTFDAPVDATIRGLLSKRVTVLWDGMDGDGAGISDAFDSNWTIICEVEPVFMGQIREALRPVKREILNARAIYAIEQGRYALVLIEARNGEGTDTVLLAPRSGAPLLRDVLTHMDAAGGDQHGPSIVAGHEPMLSELNAYHESADDGSWSFIFFSRLDIFRPLVGSAGSGVSGEPLTLAGMVKLDPDALRCSFASDFPVHPDTPDAPIQLFDVLAPDSVFTLASARAPSIGVGEDALSFNLSASTGDRESPQSPVLNAPALLDLSPGDAGSKSLTLCLLNPRREPGETARLSDDAARDLVRALDPAQGPDFAGRFPLALRQIELGIPRAIDDGEPARAPAPWPGISPVLAWKTTPTREQDLVIASIAPDALAPAKQISAIEDSARVLEALDAQAGSGVLLRLAMDPAGALSIINDPDVMDLALAKIIRRLELGIRRGIDTPVRGRLEIGFNASASSPKLGSPKP